MTDREAFEAWWKLLKPAECDEVEAHFRECWQAAIAHERERCAEVCEAVARRNRYGHAKAAAGDCADFIRSGE